MKANAEALKEEEVTHGVEDCQSQGEVTRILRNLGLTDLALAGKLMQGRHNGLEHLEDDRAGDVRHDAQRKHRHIAQRAAREKIQEGHSTCGDRIVIGREKAQHPLEGNAGHRNVRTNAVHDEHSYGKKNLFAQFFDAESILKTI